jgi:hypothetical protein
MSKPDPSITANLLSALPKAVEPHGESKPKATHKAEPEAKGPSPKVYASTKPASSKGAGHMRSSNRGK